MEALDVLAVMAHPDDAEILCGGSLLKSARRGERTGVLDLTAGEAGSRGSAELRAREAEAAAEVLGLAVRRNAGLPDAGLYNSPEARVVVATLLRELRPRVVVTHWTRGRHPDHTAAAALAYDACYLAGLRRFAAPGDPHRPLKILHAIAFREDAPRPTVVVDITDELEGKLQALACYPSQFTGVSGMGEIFPAGSLGLAERVRARAVEDGSLIRARYGEPFWCREVSRLETLGAAEVNTF